MARHQWTKQGARDGLNRRKRRAWRRTLQTMLATMVRGCRLDYLPGVQAIENHIVGEARRAMKVRNDAWVHALYG